MSKVIRHLKDIPALCAQDIQKLKPITEHFEFRVSSYYADLIDWTNPNDPLRRIILPGISEIQSDLEFDPSHEGTHSKVRGLQHKYGSTALLLVNDVCAAYCRFCFRKRFTLAHAEKKETTFDIREGLNYIRHHPEINNVLLTGGDPLMLSVRRLNNILKAMRQIPHVRIIRIGSKVPAFDPDRLTDALLDMLAEYSSLRHRLYLIVHFNHPRELTGLAKARLDAAMRRGLIVYNQTPLLRGVNNNPAILAALFNELAASGIRPYYLFHCRPTKGNDSFMMTLQEGIHIVDQARRGLSGLAKPFHYTGSHATGKIEITGLAHGHLIMRYHQPRHIENQGRILLWPVNKPVYWFDEVIAYNKKRHTFLTELPDDITFFKEVS